MNTIDILEEIKGDITSCKNRAIYLLQFPAIDKRILIAGIVLIFLMTLFSTRSEPDFYIKFVKIILASAFTFIIFTQSDTFWFLVKKAWVYNLVLHNRKNIKITYQKNLSSRFKKEKYPIAQILLITKNDAVLYKNHLRRIFAEIIILLIIIYFLFPVLIIYNILVFLLMSIYTTLFEGQSIEFIRQDIKTLVNSVATMYKKDPEECKKFIYGNEASEVRDLQIIYSVIKNFKI